MMNRRGFIGTLFASIGALTVDPGTWLWQPSVQPALPPLTPGALVTLPVIARQLQRELGQLWQPTRLCQAGRIGDDVLTGQINVAMALPQDLDQHGLDVEHYIRPAARTLAERLQRHRAQVCGCLPINIPTVQSWRVTDASTNVSLRVIQQYVLPNQWTPDGLEGDLLRVDVLYG